MTSIPAIDANVILRFLTNDDPERATKCAQLLENVELNRQQVRLPNLVLADVVWTLEKYYKQPKEKIADMMASIVNLKGLRCSNKETVLLALRLYVEHNVDWTDAFVASQLLATKTPAIYSYDRDFSRIQGISRIEP